MTVAYFRGGERPLHFDLADQMLRQRAAIFGERLGERAKIEEGWELDAFDALDPLYVVALDKTARWVKGSFRYLPTTGPTLLNSAFGRQFENLTKIESPLIWECTRFTIAPVFPRVLTKAGACRTTVELMMAACALALESGVAQTLGLLRCSASRRYRRIGWTPEIIAVSETGLAVGLWDISQDALARMSERHGFSPMIAHA
jgi:N-acyl-L-homoserine lactone synthetase